VVDPSASAPCTSKTSTPPEAPFHGAAPSVGPSVAVVYCGTRITW
jgi:hypothetical protein